MKKIIFLWALLAMMGAVSAGAYQFKIDSITVEEFPQGMKRPRLDGKYARPVIIETSIDLVVDLALYGDVHKTPYGYFAWVSGGLFDLRGAGYEDKSIELPMTPEGFRNPDSVPVYRIKVSREGKDASLAKSVVLKEPQDYGFQGLPIAFKEGRNLLYCAPSLSARVADVHYPIHFKRFLGVNRADLPWSKVKELFLNTEKLHILRDEDGIDVPDSVYNPDDQHQGTYIVLGIRDEEATLREIMKDPGKLPEEILDIPLGQFCGKGYVLAMELEWE